MPVILATQEAELRKIEVRREPRQIVPRPYLKKSLHKRGLLEWIKVCKPSVQIPNTEKKKKCG
jgi:hypothetical protein